jgi:MerR family transcriptional regulator, thiopeptide resistance regulator
MDSYWKIGELARRTGISIRMLRHYDEIGLCSPARRSPAGYRLYSAKDLRRLQQIVSLRQLGLSLEEVSRCLESRRFSPEEVIELQIARLDAVIDSQQKLRTRLERLAAHLRASEEISPDEFIQLIEEMTMFDKYYTPEQLEELRQRAEKLGPAGMEQAQNDWQELIEAVRREMEQGTDPRDERVQLLARKWNSLIAAFTGGNPGIEQSLGRLWKEQGETLSEQHGHGLDPRLAEYIGRARAGI